MKLKVPFVKGLKKWKGSGWCGPIALSSVLKNYRIDFNVEEVVKSSGSRKKGGTSPHGLAYCCLKKGLKVIYLNKFKKFDINRKQYSKKLKEFFKKVEEQKVDNLYRKKCEKYKDFNFIQKNPTLKDVERYIKENKPVLLYLNISKVYNKNKLSPHYVVIVGYDKNNFYMHNIYPKNIAYEKVKKNIFKKALLSDGLDPTLIIPYK